MMLNQIKMGLAPVVRLFSAQEIEHEETFRQFAQHLGRSLVDERVRMEPRIISFRARARRR